MCVEQCIDQRELNLHNNALVIRKCQIQKNSIVNMLAESKIRNITSGIM